ncbi:glycogen synthase GlgA [Bacillus dakarensis]|uniref:glycogen synthase GlgA n=1 Tax=Robertmurraya dakarensis TaxID=1926278 RepID=UPI0009814F8D|nr:glycogen synthase GlgA [Bacillus dakarensis]
MKVLFAVSECVPFVKSGGLADVAGSLPKELKNLGTDIRVILPKYGSIPGDFRKQMKKKADFTVKVGWRNQYCGIEELVHEGITFYFIDNEYYFNREKLYGYFDDGERFAFFNRAVLESLPFIQFIPDVIHCHDWHSGMIPFLLRVQYQHRKGYQLIKSVFTIHNLQFQGIMPKSALGDLLGLGDEYFTVEQLEFYGNINFMKAALVAGDKITTVSPTYMREIQMEYYGEKLDGLLRKRSSDLAGILNGIDDDFYDPEEDSLLLKNYSAANLKNKSLNKKEIQRQFALPEKEDIPLMVMITRLTKQKGLDLVKRVFHEMMSEDIQLIVLGTGDPEFEHFFRDMEGHYPNKFKAYIGFNEELAHQIYAAGDLFLMPSLFEPCGLGQMIAMRYGTIPIVRETGGLNDTVQSYNEITQEGNGFTFTNFNAHDMLYTIQRAIYFYHQKEMWETLVKQTMSLDYSWAQSAFKYNQLYAELISRSESHVL